METTDEENLLIVCALTGSIKEKRDALVASLQKLSVNAYDISLNEMFDIYGDAGTLKKLCKLRHRLSHNQPAQFPTCEVD